MLQPLTLGGMLSSGRRRTSIQERTMIAGQVNPVATATLRKVTRRLIPFLFLLYIIAWLDRANVGFAALHMNSDLGFTSAAFGLGSGIFFIGYLLFEVPSNLILDRVGARLWIARIMVTWGLVSVATMFIRTPASFYILRFLLGVAEAGFFPGVIYYLGLWYPISHRAKAIAGFMIAIPVAGLIGAPLSGVILGLDSAWSLAGWQWLFLLEGLPAIIAGCIVPLCLTDRPEGARWLGESERDWLVQTLARERLACDAGRPMTLLAALTNRTVLSLGIIALFVSIGAYGYTFWSPLIIKAVTGSSDLVIGLVVAAISAVSVSSMLANSAHADHTGELPVHAAVGMLCMAAGLIGSAAVHMPLLSIICLALIPIGWSAALGPFWTIPSRILTGRAAAAGIALVNSAGALGGFLGPSLMGYLKGRIGNHQAAFYLLGGFAIVAALILVSLRAVVQSADGLDDSTLARDAA